MGATLARVELQWDDGRTQTLEGAAAARWNELLNGALLMSAIHGSDYGPELSGMPWKQRADPLSRLETASAHDLVALLRDELCAFWDDLERRVTSGSAGKDSGTDG